MRAALTATIAIMLAWGCALGPLSVPAPPNAGTYEPGELLVEFREGTSADRIKQIHLEVGATPLEEVVPLIWRAEVPVGAETRWIPRFEAHPEVRDAELNARVHHKMVGSFRPAGGDRAGQVAVTDPLAVRAGEGLPGQWGLTRIGLCSAVTGGQLDCAAWARTTGAGVKVAVIDTGIDAGHPEFKGRLDRGANFVEGGGAPPDDDFGHGTHVAGIIGAANDGAGTVGVAPGAAIVPIRVLGVDGGNTAGLIAGLAFAVKAGARVVNLSLGSAQTSGIEARQMAQAIDKGVVVVAAAGNEALAGNPLEHPAAIPGVVAVAATRPKAEDVEARFQEHAPFSNYNPFVWVAAPGVDILSTVPRRFFPVGTTSSPYAYASGTSMAAPIVSGVAALLIGNRMDPANVRKHLQATAETLPAGSTGFSDFYGWGMVNVRSALP